jgi:hypothetical protein
MNLMCCTVKHCVIDACGTRLSGVSIATTELKLTKVLQVTRILWNGVCVCVRCDQANGLVTCLTALWLSALLLFAMQR